MRILVGFGVVALTGACASSPPGPTALELVNLIPDAGPPTPVIRSVDCVFIAEEGSEWVCRYQRRTRAGLWAWHSDAFALDGGQWVWIGSVAAPDPEPQP